MGIPDSPDARASTEERAAALDRLLALVERTDCAVSIAITRTPLRYAAVVRALRDDRPLFQGVIILSEMDSAVALCGGLEMSEQAINKQARGC